MALGCDASYERLMLSPAAGLTFRDAFDELLSVIPKIPSNTPESGAVSVRVMIKPEGSLIELTVSWTVFTTLESTFGRSPLL